MNQWRLLISSARWQFCPNWRWAKFSVSLSLMHGRGNPFDRRTDAICSTTRLFLVLGLPEGKLEKISCVRYELLLSLVTPTRCHRIQNSSELRRCRTPRNGEQNSSPIWARDEVDADTEPRISRTSPSEAPTTPTGRFPTGPPATQTVRARPRQPFRLQNRRNLFNDTPVSSTRTAWSQTRS